MKKKKCKLIISLVVLIVMNGVASAAYSCSCFSPPPCEAFNRAKSVFIGRPIQASQKSTTVSDGKTRVSYYGEVLFEVMEAFSGVNGRFITVWVSGPDGCGSEPFTAGEATLVYGIENKDDQKLWAIGCGRSHQIAPIFYGKTTNEWTIKYFQELQKEYVEELAYLRSITAGKLKGARLSGSVTVDARELRKGSKGSAIVLPNITIKAIREGQVFETRTDYEGKFDLQGLLPGKYSISAVMPDGYEPGYYEDKREREFTLRDCGCASTYFSFRPDNKLRGQVLDAEGKPVASIQVNLFSADWQGEDITDNTIKSFQTNYVATDNEGRFTLGDLLDGRYLLGVNVVNVLPQHPYPRTYYPNVGNTKDAEVITIEHGQKIGPVEIRLSAKLPKHTIEGLVLWPDGTLAIGASVRLRGPGKYDYESLAEVTTDERGHFTLPALKDRQYTLKVYWHDDEGVSGKIGKSPLGWQSATSNDEALTVTEDIKDLKLILSKRER